MNRKLITILKYRTIFILLVALCIFASSIPARADGSTNPQPAVDPNSSWGQVVDANGNIQYSNLKDGGVIQQQANWMLLPTITSKCPCLCRPRT